MEQGEAPHPGPRVGIFRRVAVERYMQPLDAATPEMLVTWNGALFGAGIVLLGSAIVGLLAL